MAPSSITVNDTLLKKVETEVTTALVHPKKLLRLRPQELAMFPTSFQDTSSHLGIMRNAPEMRWNVQTPCLALMGSEPSPRAIFSEFNLLDDTKNAKTEEILDRWRDRQKFRGHRLHTFKISGLPFSFAHFSWIFEHPLPRLECPMIHMGTDLYMSDLVDLPLTMTSTFLRVLDLRNAALPWSSNLFTGLSELHLDFLGCSSIVDMQWDELLRIFDASPQLGWLPLGAGRTNDPLHWQQPAVTLQAGRVPSELAHLEIYSCSGYHISWSLNHFFPDDRLPKRLFRNPPVLEVWKLWYGGRCSIEFNTGSFKVVFPLDEDDCLNDRNVVLDCIPLAPPSVETLRFSNFPTTLSKQHLRGFFGTHPEVRSIERSDDMFKSFWDALSPADEGGSGHLVPGTRVDPPLGGQWYTGVGAPAQLSSGPQKCRVQARAPHYEDELGRFENLRPSVKVFEVDFPDRSARIVNPDSIDG